MGLQVIQLENVFLKGYEEDDIFGKMKHEKCFFEQDILTAWYPYYKDSKVMLDVGANLGNHSVYWACHTQAEIYAFEPHPANFALLESNIARNHLVQIYPERKAVGTEAGKAVLRAPVSTKHLGNASFVYGSGENADVDMISLDQYAAQHGLSRIDFVKIDTEGFELEVLHGMRNMLHRDAPAVWVETEPEHAEAVCSFLEQLDYCLADIRGMNCLFLSSRRNPEHHRMSCGALTKKVLELHERAVSAEIRYAQLLDQASER